ncbi:glycosyltransferase [Leptotrichia sp. OH3620_COT-345]|uniref:glycosyltransferase family 2 protein n=1 Tax=Leptotrichia sp. OH3620_COT-345 TaxID=2491048 RepID=UPI000F64F7F2|nr:glycosyltransferase family 2 protein [Leptotrichia sp. OH3620_COT-345]RRD40501.1 glycosyltransferase [Leptotrichia sp. OH3620_COT-345]
MEISFIIPVYNEEKNIPLLLKKLEETVENKYVDYEFIFINDGSTDLSGEILHSLSLNKSYVKIISLEKNSGQSKALYKGFNLAKGEIIVSLDGDLQADPTDIILLLPYLEKYDMVNGARSRRKNKNSDKLFSVLGNHLRNIIVGDDIQDVASSMKIFKKKVLKCFYPYTGMYRILPVLAQISGFSVAEIPVPYYDRIFGKSNYTFYDRFFTSLKNIFIVKRIKKKKRNYNVNCFV